MSRKRALIFISLILITGCNRSIVKPFVRDFIFPEDLAPHREYPIEWWYQTGYFSYREDTIPDFAYEFTLFRMHQKESPGWPRILFIPFGEIYVSHFVLYNIRTKERIFVEDIYLPKFLVAGKAIKFSKKGFFLKSNGKKIDFLFKGNLDTMFLKLNVEDSIHIAFQFLPEKSPVPHYNGVIKIGNSGESYYYSLTDVEIKGSLRIDNTTYNVSGKTWFDQQWGNFHPEPWDWFSIRLESGEEFMLFNFPGADWRAGTYIKRDGSYQYIQDFKLNLSREITTKTGKKLPIPAPALIQIPEIDAEIEVEAMGNEQLNYSQYTPVYWEGICKVRGRIGEREIKGFAFFENWR